MSVVTSCDRTFPHIVFKMKANLASFMEFFLFPSFLTISIKNQTLRHQMVEPLHITGAQMSSFSGYFLILRSNQLEKADVHKLPVEKWVGHQPTG